jgi:hypothetical protein
MVYNAPQTDLEMKKCSQRQQGRTTAQLNPERTFTKCSQHEQNPELQCWVLHCHQEPCMRLAPEDYGDEGSSRVTEALSRHLVHVPVLVLECPLEFSLAWTQAARSPQNWLLAPDCSSAVMAGGRQGFEASRSLLCWLLSFPATPL